MPRPQPRRRRTRGTIDGLPSGGRVKGGYVVGLRSERSFRPDSRRESANVRNGSRPKTVISDVAGKSLSSCNEIEKERSNRGSSPSRRLRRASAADLGRAPSDTSGRSTPGADRHRTPGSCQAALVTTAYDRTVLLWDVHDPARLRPLADPLLGNPAAVPSAVKFSPDEHSWPRQALTGTSCSGTSARSAAGATTSSSAPARSPRRHESRRMGPLHRRTQLRGRMRAFFDLRLELRRPRAGRPGDGVHTTN